MRTAKLFKNGRSQAVRLPAEFRFAGDEVLIRKDAATGDVILREKPASLERFFELRDRLLRESKREIDALSDERDQGSDTERDWF